MTYKSSTEQHLQDLLKAQLNKGDKPATPEPVVGVFTTIETVDTTNKRSFKDIVGVDHPSGEHWFSLPDPSLWSDEAKKDIPKDIPDYEFHNLDYALALLMNISYDKPSLAVGPAGTGKSTDPEVICARIGMPYKFVQGMGNLEATDFTGSPWAENGSMTYKLADAAKAIRDGYFLLYDEPFKTSDQANMWLQTLLDNRRTVTLVGHPEEGKLKAHTNFRIGLADNVAGLGDNMDKYAAGIQDQSTINRLKLKVHCPYPPQAFEVAMLQRMSPTISEPFLKKMVQVANKLRDAWNKGDVARTFSLRDTIEWADQTVILRDIRQALNFCWLNGVDRTSPEGEEEYKAVENILTIVGL